MTLPQTILKVRTHLLDLIFPIVCLNCGKEGLYLCKMCNAKLKRDEFQICPVCGKPNPFGATHIECKSEVNLDGLVSAVPYKEPLARKLVEHCKYRFISDIAPTLGQIIAEEILNLELTKSFENFTVVPLPLHPKRKNWRGFNQSELIAIELNKHLNLRLDPTILYRKIHTKVQAELKDEERKTNVAGAFASDQNLSGRKILLIDDVSTTRSTLSQACLALKNNGASEVWAAVFAQG